jgi:hypothetical protein
MQSIPQITTAIVATMTNITATITIIKITTMNSTNLKIIKIMLTITS